MWIDAGASQIAEARAADTTDRRSHDLVMSRAMIASLWRDAVAEGKPRHRREHS
jgi:hypothetical protein